MITRREFVAGSAVLALTGTALSALDWNFVGTAFAQTPSAADLAVAGPLGDEVQGKADAPVTIIEEE